MRSRLSEFPTYTDFLRSSPPTAEIATRKITAERIARCRPLAEFLREKAG